MSRLFLFEKVLDKVGRNIIAFCLQNKFTDDSFKLRQIFSPAVLFHKCQGFRLKANNLFSEFIIDLADIQGCDAWNIFGAFAERLQAQDKVSGFCFIVCEWLLYDR